MSGPHIAGQVTIETCCSMNDLPATHTKAGGVTGGPEPAVDPNGYWAPRQVAEMLGKSGRTVRRWLASGELPSIRLGHSVLIPASALQNLLAARLTARAMARAHGKSCSKFVFINEETTSKNKALNQ